MTQVKLMGEMGKKFGENWTSADSSIRDILRLIDCQTSGLANFLGDCHDKNIQFSIQTGKELIEEFPELYMNTHAEEIIITPVPAGSGKGLGKLITGLLMLAALFFMPGLGGMFTASGGLTAGGAISSAGMAGLGAGGTLSLTTGAVTGLSASQAAAAGLSLSLTTGGMAVAMLGVNLAMMGLAEMSAPDPDKTTDDPSYLFNGAENHIEQGKPVPLLYGEMTIGGSVIHQGYAPGITTSSYSWGFGSGLGMSLNSLSGIGTSGLTYQTIATENQYTVAGDIITIDINKDAV